MIRVLALLAAFLLSPAAWADARLDIAANQPLPPLAELVVTGVSHAKEARTVVVRVDDRMWPEYADRVNEERKVLPGPFTFRLRLASRHTPRGRPLDIAHIRFASAFAADQAVDVQTMTVDRPPALPEGTFGWFFGPEDAAPLAGFKAVSPKDPAVTVPVGAQVHRPSQDPVLAWGMSMTAFETSLPPGRWHLTFWTEDPGEWETLPQVLERRIRLNGADVILERRDEAAWVRHRYLAGRDIEADPSAPPYRTLGGRRGGRISTDVTLTDGKIHLELAGYPRAATHLAAITASPADNPMAAEDAVESVRASRFAEAWPVLADPVPQLAAAARANAAGLTIDGADHVPAAPGGVAIFTVSVHSPAAATAHVRLEGDGRVLWGMWRWRRPGAEVPGLILSAAHLRGDSSDIPLRADLPRSLTVLVPLPADAKPGERTTRLVLTVDGRQVAKTLHVEVLAAKRPEPRARVGAFLDFAPHLSGDPAGARRQAACDLDTLRGLGLTAVAPPVSTPEGDMSAFLSDLRAAAARFSPPFVAYAPARRLGWNVGVVEAGKAVARADAAARAAGLPVPVWTVADEPAAAGTMEDAQDLAAHLRLANREARLAGHLNSQADVRILRELDLVTVNAGYGATARDVAAMREGGRAVWLYNLPRLRLAAGFFLWRSGADGLLQWHARMPTADAFDPTDGREGDVQFLWPMPDICQSPDLDTDLLDLVDGQEDLRWIAWLEAAAASAKPGAQPMLTALRAAVPEAWTGVESLPLSFAADWRGRIVGLARELSNQ